MFRKLAIAVITAWAALLETVADAIAATLPPRHRQFPAAGGHDREVMPPAAHRVTASEAGGKRRPGAFAFTPEDFRHRRPSSGRAST